jgi:phage shock protein PspC (stress-responsive transcriptional regulator)
MIRNTADKWLGGVIAGFASWLGLNSSFLRVVFIVLFFGVGGLSFGIGSGAVAVIYFLLWWLVKDDSKSVIDTKNYHISTKCRHCKNPNVGKLQICEWCGYSVYDN